MENLQRKLSTDEDSVALYFRLSYEDIELYSVTIQDAYRTPSCSIMNKSELDVFLEAF